MISSHYFDYAAATPIDPEVLTSMLPYLGEKFHNPSAGYLASKQIADDINQARASVASQLGCRPSEVIFTAGGTEANNLVVNGVVHLHEGFTVVCSSVEHDSVMEPVQNYDHKLVAVKADGVLDLNDLERTLTDKTVLISVMYVNNELGTIQPLKEIAAVVEKIRQDRQNRTVVTPLYFHTDASQAGNFLNLKVASLGVDMMTINGGKIYGPKQSGALYIKAGINLRPQVLGGGQERSMRSGTENVAGIVGLSSALNIAQSRKTDELKRLQELQKFAEKLLQDVIPKVQINGGTKRAPHILHITIAGIDNERVMMELDEVGFQVAVGSACSASSDEPSHVLKAIGLSDLEAQSSLRISLGRYNDKAAISSLVNQLSKIIS